MMSKSQDFSCTPRRTRLFVGLLVGTHVVLLAWGAACHSPTFDEVAHLPAGISHWKFARFELFRVNPPLVRMVAAIPLLPMNVKMDWSRYDGKDTARSDFRVGKDFVAANGRNVFVYYTIARWMCIPFSVVGALVCYAWAKRLYGAASGFIALALWCLSPTVLAHAELLTPDVGATALGAAAGFAFWRWLKVPSGTNSAIAGAGLALAELCKTTWLVLFALWPVLWVMWRLTDHERASRAVWLRQSGQLAAVLLVGLFAINLAYGFEGSFARLADYRFTSNALRGQRDQYKSRRPPRNRFQDSWVGVLPVPLPKNYVLGVDHQKKNFEARFWSYLRGECRRDGWMYYYIYAMLIKIPIGTWVIGLMALTVGLAPRRWLYNCPRDGTRGSVEAVAQSAIGVGGKGPQCRPGEFALYRATWRDALIVLAPAFTILFFVSMQTGINKHLRYVLPAFPFLIVWVSKVGQYANFRWTEYQATQPDRHTGGRPAPPAFTTRDASRISATPQRLDPARPANVARRVRNARTILGVMIVVALTWAAASSLYVYPHSLSYFNELVGGPREGHWHLGTSNTDWGQDLYYLESWYHQHPQARPLHVEYGLPLIDPEILGIEYEDVPYGPIMNREGAHKTSNWPWGEIEQDPESRLSTVDLPSDTLVWGPLTGWYAIGVNRIHLDHGRYEYLLEFTPTAMAGYSTRIYHISRDQANQARRKLGLPPLPENVGGPND